MQELVLILPGRTAEKEFAHEAAAAALRREFEERLAECGPLAYRVARGVLRNSADAEDVAQEALLRAYRRFDRLRDRTRFRAWLVRIAFRLAIDRARSSKRREVRETLWSQTAPRPSTEDMAATSEFQEHLDRAMEELPEKRRLVLLLAAMQGHSLEEVAEMLGLPIGTVKSRLFFAQKAVSGEIAMPCENYREALIDAAAADSAPSRELRSHLEACVSCRAAFTEEVQLFASIDTGVRATANSEMPASLLPRVRAELNERPIPQRSWIPAGAALAAAAALVVAIVSVRGFGRGAVETNPPMIAATHNGSPAVIQPSTEAAAPSETTSAPAKIRSVRPVEPTSFAEIEEIKVLIPAGQKQAIDALLVSVQQGKVEADVLLTEKPTGTLEELQVPPLVISPIEVKPLADVNTESASPNEKTRR